MLQTILFTDIVGSTDIAAKLGDERWRELLAAHDRIVAVEVERNEGRVVKSLGDGSMAAFAGPARAVRCAQAIVDDVAELDLVVRAGIHAGECEVIGDDLGGLAVHIAARVASAAGPAEILVSSTVRELVFGSGIEFTERGHQELKGVPGEWALYVLATDEPQDARAMTESTEGGAAAATMRPIDRATVAISRRAPGLARLGMRIGSRRS
jgi:class 3 adenylate cyclase